MSENKEQVIEYRLKEYDEIPIPSVDGKYRKLDIQVYKYMTNAVRRVMEFKDFMYGMKHKMKLNNCTLYKNYSIDKGFHVELHHAPLTLFNITEAICNKQYDENKDENGENGWINEWRVKEEVIQVHYRFNVGVIPLNPTAHSLADSGVMKLHPDWISGDWRSFVKEYDKYISDDARRRIFELEEFTNKNPNETPELMKYIPTIITNNKYTALGGMNFRAMLLEKHKERLQLVQKKEPI